jgi:hypothetical protein
MADKPMDVYLNDHLGGAMLGSDLAEQIRDRSEGTALGEVMTTVAAEIEDRETLLELMDRMGTTRNPVKQVSGWVAEKASRVKFSGATSGVPEQGLFMALAAVDLERLVARASTQEETLERERMAAGLRALGGA